MAASTPINGLISQAELRFSCGGICGGFVGKQEKFVSAKKVNILARNVKPGLIDVQNMLGTLI
jgi:hypothetical protein